MIVLWEIALCPQFRQDLKLGISSHKIFFCVNFSALLSVFGESKLVPIIIVISLGIIYGSMKSDRSKAFIFPSPQILSYMIWSPVS